MFDISTPSIRILQIFKADIAYFTLNIIVVADIFLQGGNDCEWLQLSWRVDFSIRG